MIIRKPIDAFNGSNRSLGPQVGLAMCQNLPLFDLQGQMFLKPNFRFLAKKLGQLWRQKSAKRCENPQIAVKRQIIGSAMNFPPIGGWGLSANRGTRYAPKTVPGWKKGEILKIFNCGFYPVRLGGLQLLLKENYAPCPKVKPHHKRPKALRRSYGALRAKNPLFEKSKIEVFCGFSCENSKNPPTFTFAKKIFQTGRSINDFYFLHFSARFGRYGPLHYGDLNNGYAQIRAPPALVTTGFFKILASLESFKKPLDRELGHGDACITRNMRFICKITEQRICSQPRNIA